MYDKMTRGIMRHMRTRSLLLSLICVACWLAACAHPRAEPTPSPPPDTALLVADLLHDRRDGGALTLVGYLYADGQRAVLTPGLSGRPNEPPLPLPAAPAQQVWLGAAPEPAIAPRLQQQGATRYGLVEVQGQLDGPGAFGPDGLYPYRMRPTAYLLLMPQPVTLAELTADSGTYEEQYVRVSGVLLASDDSLLLVDATGEGGVPAPGSTPVKLVWPLRDPAVVAQLSQPPDSAVRFGAVQVEGLWRNGTLRLLKLALRE
jgi:hypothetical protein